jgi:hypothetical protein
MRLFVRQICGSRTEKKHEAAAAEEHQVGGHGEWEGTLQAYNEAKNDPL